MFDEYFKRDDVKRLISEFQQNPKCLRKSAHEESTYGKNIHDELALYLFYDTIFKYKLIVDDMEQFPDFLLQVEKLFRKIESCDDICVGVNRLLINLVASKLDVRDCDSKEGRYKIIPYFYQHYIVDGYLMHGFSSSYEEFIKGRNFLPEQYPHNYVKMLKVKQIFEKHKMHFIEKEFKDNTVHFTDDFVMACHYSIASPGYFFQFILNCMKDSKAFFLKNHSLLMSSLKRFMSNNLFSKSEQRTVLKTIDEEWNILNRSPRKVALLFVKRSKVVGSSNDKLRDYLESDKDLEEIVDRIFSSKYGDVVIDKMIRYGDYQLLLLDDFYQQNSVEKEDKSVPVAKRSFQLANSYGMASILLILGSFCITLGVIFTIIMILRGM